jgi:antitoxin HicB
MIEDAKKAWLETALEQNSVIPEPAEDGYSGKLHLRLPKFLHRSLATQAKREGVSLNTYITSNLSRVM